MDSLRRDPLDSTRPREIPGWVWYPAARDAGTAVGTALDEPWNELRATASAAKIGTGAATLMREMRVHALRRRPELSRADAFVDRVYPAGELLELCAVSDYLLASAPLTPATQGMLGEAQFRAPVSA